jgi:HPt (histidine-containing phosphotransfer) domain-containing protein
MDGSEITFTLTQTRCNLDHDEVLVRDMAAIFITDIPELCERLAKLNGITDSPPQDSADQVKHIAHSIKGLARTFGAEPLASMAERVEKSPQEWLTGNPSFLNHFRHIGCQSASRLADELGITRPQSLKCPPAT